MTDVHMTNGAVRLGIDAIDRIGVARIAEVLGISPQAVRKWRRKGKIPDDRQDVLRQMLAALPDQASALSQVAEVSKAAKVAPPVSRRATGSDTKEGGSKKPVNQALAVMPADPPRLEQIAGQHAQASMTLLIAARDVDQARVVVDKAAADADGLPPVLPVRGYKTRLGILFALDFPILTMAFVAVTQVSPMIAAGSAIALSLGLVLCAHAAGAKLRALAEHLPAWVRDLTALVTMVLLIAAVIGVATDLRLKGFELDSQILEGAQAGIFSEQTDVPSNLPEPFVWAIVRAAGLVTILLTIFGITWSYQHHGPGRAFARAEKAYRKALRRYASAVARTKAMSAMALAIVVTTLIGLATVDAAHAAGCPGPSVLAFVDTTTAYDEQDRELIMPAIDDMVRSLASGSRLIIRTVRDAPTSSRLLLDLCTPTASAFTWTLDGVWRWLTSNPMDARTAEADFHVAIRDALLPELRQQGDAPATALVDTLAHFAGEVDRLRSVWLFTDLLESVKTPIEALLSRSDSLIRTMESTPALAGVTVHVAGVGRFHDQSRRPLTSKEFGILVDSWAGFVRRSGGELHVSR